MGIINELSNKTTILFKKITLLSNIAGKTKNKSKKKA